MRVVPRAVIASASKRAASFRSEQRLHRPEEFLAVMAVRRVVRGQSFDLHYRGTDAGACVRLGLIVPKRLARAASLRNAIKRQGREAFRLMAVQIPPCDLILRLTRPIKNVRAADVEQRKVWRSEIETLLKRLPTHLQ
ncbi:MAG: ribonuclease P protein component [Sulfuritalea sp.]|nr:ribonuclease P protein component [Sulfuritalea sp.]